MSQDDAAEYPHVERGMTLGTVIEHRDSGDWGVVTDVLDDGRVQLLNLEEIEDSTILLFEDASGCEEHLETAQKAAKVGAGGVYNAPPDIFDVLGPTHPEFRGETDAN